MAGRPRKPTAVLEMRGSYEKHPERRAQRAHEPASGDPLGPAPAYLDEAEQARYEQIRGWCPWLLAEHQPLVERTAKLWMRLRNGLEKAHDEAQFTANLSKLGMTPTDRSRVQVPKAQPKTSVERYAS